MKNDTLSSQIREHDNADRKIGQDLRQLVDTRLFEDRPTQPKQLERACYVGGQTLKVRRPEHNEVGLSQSEIDLAIQYGIKM